MYSSWQTDGSSRHAAIVTNGNMLKKIMLPQELVRAAHAEFSRNYAIFIHSQQLERKGN